jgi:hypothetical protein
MIANFDFAPIKYNLWEKYFAMDMIQKDDHRYDLFHSEADFDNHSPQPHKKTTSQPRKETATPRITGYFDFVCLVI